METRNQRASQDVLVSVLENSFQFLWSANKQVSVDHRIRLWLNFDITLQWTSYAQFTYLQIFISIFKKKKKSLFWGKHIEQSNAALWRCNSAYVAPQTTQC